MFDVGNLIRSRLSRTISTWLRATLTEDTLCFWLWDTGLVLCVNHLPVIPPIIAQSSLFSNQRGNLLHPTFIFCMSFAL